MSGRFAHAALRALERVNRALLPKSSKAESWQTGRRGEEDAYFYLRNLGYVMVARNWRTPRRKGELDLVGWDGDVLCFVEVKTRTTLDVKPAEAAVDAEKQAELGEMAREFLRVYLRAGRSRLTTETQRHGENKEEKLLRAEAWPEVRRRVSSWWKPGSEGEGRPGSAALGERVAASKTRFDVLSIYYLEDCGKPRFALFKDCFPLA